MLEHTQRVIADSSVANAMTSLMAPCTLGQLESDEKILYLVAGHLFAWPVVKLNDGIQVSQRPRNSARIFGLRSD